MQDMEWIVSGPEGLERIKPLWEKLNAHHLELSDHFKDHYRKQTFENRKKDLLEKASGGKFRVEIARIPSESRDAGYCVSSISAGGEGEIESILIDSDFRGKGIGETLMKNALEWMDNSGVKSKKVSVGAGNESAFGFYEKFGFRPRLTILVQIPEDKKA